MNGFRVLEAALALPVSTWRWGRRERQDDLLRRCLERLEQRVAAEDSARAHT